MGAIVGLAALAFLAGTAFGTYQQRDTGGGQTAAESGGQAGDEVGDEAGTDRQEGSPDEGETGDDPAAPTATTTVTDTAGTSGDEGAGPRLAFVAFDQTIALVDSPTDPAFNNSVGVDLDEFGAPFEDGEQPSAVIADLIVRGPAGTTVALHPGDRPSDAMRFTVPGSGRLLVQHLLAVPDDAGRITVSTSEEAEVELAGHGRYLPAPQARAGRFVPTGSIRIGSLVTATDGRTLTMDLASALGEDAAQVGLAVVRLNANVGPTGGSVSVGSGEPIPWPAPAVADLAMAGTELLTVRPTGEGEIEMEYLGGSVMTVDLVGYYTNDQAPESTEGLLVLAERPHLETIEIGDTTAALTLEGDGREDGATTGGSITVIEVANDSNPGAVTIWTGLETRPQDPTFALAPSQQRSTTAWLSRSPDQDHLIDGPSGATVQVWTLGSYT